MEMDCVGSIFLANKSSNSSSLKFSTFATPKKENFSEDEFDDLFED